MARGGFLTRPGHHSAATTNENDAARGDVVAGTGGRLQRPRRRSNSLASVSFFRTGPEAEATGGISAGGAGTIEIMRQTSKSKTCVWRWQERFMQDGVEGLLRDKTRPSRIPPLGPEVAERVVRLTLEVPPGETTHWTADMVAKASGISASAVRRIWRTHGLQPHRWRQFKLSNDPHFVAKLRDVVGLYVDPPAHAIVLSFDEKSQIQALDRTQPGLPMKKGRLGTMTHDYKRHGTTTLFAALNVLDGTVIGGTVSNFVCGGRFTLRRHGSDEALTEDYGELGLCH